MTSNIESTPTKKSNNEIITPHKLTVAVLIRDYCQYRDSDIFSSENDGTLKSKYRRDFSVLILKLLQSPDLPLAELMNILRSNKYEIHRSVINSFNETLANLYSLGSGTLLDVIDSLNRIMTYNNESLGPGIESNCLVSKSSIVGYYLRRLIVNFDRLSFSEVTSVYLTFMNYYREWQRSLLVPHNRNTPAVNKVMCPDDWSANRDQWSRRQAELFIATQAALLTNNEEKALPPEELQNRISNLLKLNPSLSEAHFLAYLNYLRVKEFCGAINSLYHCFDRSTLTDSKISSEDKSKVYRFAALNLAVLHYHFGHKEEALASLKEAIKLSQANNDNVCLQHSLCWLYRLTPLNKEKLIEHSVSKSFELNLSYTTSLGIQTFVQYACLISGHPHQIFETLAKGDLINCQHILKELVANSYAVKSALWQFYGKSEMSSLWSQLLFFLNVDNSNDSKAVYSEGFCLGICNVANHLLMQGSYALVSTVLNFAKERFPSEPNSHIWMLCENLFIFIRALHHENWNEAEAAAQKILVVDKWEGYLRLAELYYYKQDYIEAHRYVDTLLNRFESDNKHKLRILCYIRAKILLAEIQFSSTHPDKISPGIITLLNNCLIETNKYHLDYQSALIHLHIANIQLSLGMTAQALRVLERCLVQILSHGGSFDRARAMLLCVKCTVAHSGQLEANERRDVLLRSADMLDKVKEDFRAVEAFSRVKDVLYLQAQLYNAIDMRNERNKCSLEFRLMDEERTTKNYYTLVKFL